MSDLRKERAMRKALPWWYRLLCEAAWWTMPRGLWREAARRRRWLFVTGANRSGKTILANLLRLHPEVTLVPNASHVSDALPNSLSEGCPHVWTERLGRFRLTEADAGRVDHRRLLFDWLTFGPALRPVVVVESDLVAVQMRWLQAALPGCAFAAVVRNGFAAAEGVRLKEGYDIGRCARHWRAANALLLADGTAIERFRLVRYETLVSAPEAVASAVCGLVGLSVQPLLPHLRAGWRLGNLDREPAPLRDANGELLSSLTPADRLAVRLAAGDMLDRLGYGVPGRPAPGSRHEVTA